MKKILVIEDEEFIRYNLMELLDAEDFDARAAENGVIGLQLVREEIPDLILCDVMMPELDGYAVLSALRSDPLTATIPFIFITARADKNDLRKGMQMGADDYLTKPFTRAELLGAIATRFKKQQAMEERYNSTLKQANSRLNRLIHYDSLTGLPNRLILRERLNQFLSKTTESSQIVPIFFLDLNRFSSINDTLGPSCGDSLLKEVARLLSGVVSPEDTVARLNADQFALILSPIHHQREAAHIAEALLDALSQSFLLNGQQVFITSSIGIAFYPKDARDIDTLIQLAETAMSHGKNRRGNSYQYYTSQMQVGSKDDRALESALYKSLSRNEFEVYYQPLVNLQTRQIVGAEALVRWKHPELGMISPGSFIPLAEANGLIIPIGEWVLKTAAKQTKLWHRSGFPWLRVSINLSCRQFSQPGLSEKIVEVLAATGLEPQAIELELTESILMQDVPSAIATLGQLQAKGIKIAIDDFGTGYCSLSYLKQFPFTTLKIDRCFVRNIANDATNSAITTAIIQMAHDLNLEVIAEGVETQDELAFLYQHGCDIMQGFLFSRPLPAIEFEQLLRTEKCLTIKN